MNQKTAVIIGAGPAGLTAADELLTRTDIKPIVMEKSSHMGGLSRTVDYKGNRIDLGGQRQSKSVGSKHRDGVSRRQVEQLALLTTVGRAR